MIIKKIIKKFGNGGAHICMPFRYVGKEVEIHLDEPECQYTTKKQVIEIVEDIVEQAKRGY